MTPYHNAATLSQIDPKPPFSAAFRGNSYCWGWVSIVMGASFGILTSLLVAKLGQARYMCVIGRSSVVPTWSARVHSWTSTPVNASAFLGLLSKKVRKTFHTVEKAFGIRLSKKAVYAQVLLAPKLQYHNRSRVPTECPTMGQWNFNNKQHNQILNRMPFVSDPASVIKSRFGFQDHSSADSVQLVRSSPYLPKSASKENLAQSSLAVRSISNWVAEDGGNSVSVVLSSQSFEFCDDPSFCKDHNVQVIIRIRPLSSTEISLQGYSKCVQHERYQTITWTGHPESRFTFDIVADENVSQTGSGKTHTMLGDIEGGTRRHGVNCRMTPRVFEHLFSRMQKEKDARENVS
ncbi:Phragmoplast orienting kinesin-1 [Morella rubra]|uniref:Phragmoplast orienting kinesin-1 n=1 Tax=Morella rubra TaxID=262757 RepID=A0A6A1WQM6_9ROSI|nr:Phragmoplast orienting kinesin-1 [Morella rubra]